MTEFNATGFKNRLFEISFNVGDPMPKFGERVWQGELTMEEVKDLWKHSGCTEEDCERIIKEWGQDTEWWGDGHIYFNYLFVRPLGLVKLIPDLKILLALKYLESGGQIDHRIDCLECGKPLKLYLHEGKYGNADCINLECGKYGYNSIGGSVGQVSPKKHFIEYCLFSKGHKKIFKGRKSKYWELLPKRVILGIWIRRMWFNLISPVYTPYLKWKMNRYFRKHV